MRPARAAHPPPRRSSARCPARRRRCVASVRAEALIALPCMFSGTPPRSMSSVGAALSTRCALRSRHGSALREAVPWTPAAINAAIDAAAGTRLGNAPAMLDGQVGDAADAEHVGCDIAPVGHTSMQRSQVPHVSLPGWSGGNGDRSRSRPGRTMIRPSVFNSSACLPRQPSRRGRPAHFHHRRCR